MADASQNKVDKQIKKIEKQINSVYGQAQAEIEAKLKEFEESYKVKKDIYYQMYKNHEITQTDYNAWRAGQLFQMEQWKAKRDQICGIVHDANAQAVKIVNGGTISAFAEGANWTAYSLEHGAGAVFGFGLYDEQTVTTLLTNDPQILPKWKIDKPKEYIWNKQKVNNCVTQGIIQGEGIQDIAKRIATVTCNQNKNLALTHARTAMTAAQNAGRMQRLQDAKKLGINVVKEWMATLDYHTRDSHRDLDGEQRPVGDLWHPVKFSNGCRYPGDPLGPAREVFNCRCTLVGDLLDYPEEYERYDNIDGKPIKSMSYNDWIKTKEQAKPKVQSKAEAKKVKTLQKKIDTLQTEADELQYKIEGEGADYVFKNIWYGKDVTYADWESVKDSIPSKIEYFEEAKAKAIRRLLVDDFGYVPSEIDDTVIYAAEKDLVHALNRIQMGISKTDDWDIIDEWFPGMSESHVMYILNNSTWLERWNKFNIHIRELNMFQNFGEEYSKLVLEHKALMSEITALRREVEALTHVSPFGVDAYSQARKDAALWAKSSREADAALRGVTGGVWRSATTGERRAVHKYTAGSGSFNRPLRGYDGSWYHKVGVGQVPLDNEGSGDDIRLMTGVIKRSRLAQDTWLQRGVDDTGLAGFLDIPEDVLYRASQEELEQLLVGRTVTDTAFMSCGSSKGAGFGGNILNVYCPRDTQAIYVEPISAFGNGDGVSWDGVSSQSSYGGELETIIQRNTTFRVVKVEKRGSRVYIDIEVVDQNPDDFSPWD